MITIDGAEGGGQILRSALTLSMITQQAFTMENIRGGRTRPGLMRQHLMAVKASATISNGVIEGATLGSQSLIFSPRSIEGGRYQFSIDGAGSTTLILQTLIPALLYANRGSELIIGGGTHNPMAPPFNFISESWLPLMRAMNADITLQLNRHGFYPKGGGEISAVIEPSQLMPIKWCEWAFMEEKNEAEKEGRVEGLEAEVLISALPLEIAERELQRVKQLLDHPLMDERITPLSNDQGPGNILSIRVNRGGIIQLFTAFGIKGKRAEQVAKECATEVNQFLASDALVSDRLADQLLLPMALAGGGMITTTRLSNHLKTNAQIIEKFLPITIQFSEKGGVVEIKVNAL